jgi:UDP-glucuronate decarboxylase
MRHVLITGSAGFLGSHLVLHHVALGDRVYGVDNYSSSKPLARHHRKIIKESGDKYLFSVADISNPEFPRLFKEIPLDIVYNFACPASPPRYQSIPVETTMTCVAGTRNVLATARHKTIVVHASTSEVYGDPDVSPQSESYRGCVNPYGPRSCYDEGKRAAEALCYDYRNKHGIDARLVRIFNTYGPHMDIEDGRVVTNFIAQAMRGSPLTVYGDGSQTRSFCYVDDLIRGITALAELPENPGTPINIGNPNEFTIKQLALKVQSIFGSQLDNRALPVDDPLQRCPDISLAKKILRWEPRVELDEGLSKTIEYFKSIELVS